MPIHPLIPDEWFEASASECLACTLKCCGNCGYCKCPLLPHAEKIKGLYDRKDPKDE